MRFKRILLGVTTGLLAISCLGAITGCGGNPDEGKLKEDFISQKKFAEPESNMFTNNEPFEIVDFSYEELSKDPDGKVLTTADVKATVKNNICELEVTAIATRTTGSNEDASYEYNIKSIEAKSVNGVNSAPDIIADSADFDSQDIQYVNGAWRSELKIVDPTFYISDAVLSLDFNSNTFLWVQDKIESYTISDGLNGTYKNPDNDITTTINKTSNDSVNVSFNNPSPKVMKKQRSVIGTDVTFSSGTATFNDVELYMNFDLDNGFIVGMNSENGNNTITWSGLDTEAWTLVPKFSVNIYKDYMNIFFSENATYYPLSPAQYDLIYAEDIEIDK